MTSPAQKGEREEALEREIRRLIRFSLRGCDFSALQIEDMINAHPAMVEARRLLSSSKAEGEMREALTKALEVNAMVIAFIGRDQGTPRMDGTLNGLVKRAVDLDAVLRAALSPKECA